MKYFRESGQCLIYEIDNIAATILESNWDKIGYRKEYHYNGEYFMFKDNKDEEYPNNVTDIKDSDILEKYLEQHYLFFKEKSDYVFECIKAQASSFFVFFYGDMKEINKLGGFLRYGGVEIVFKNGNVMKITLNFLDYYELRLFKTDNTKIELLNISCDDLDVALIGMMV